MHRASDSIPEGKSGRPTIASRTAGEASPGSIGLRKGFLREYSRRTHFLLANRTRRSTATVGAWVRSPGQLGFLRLQGCSSTGEEPRPPVFPKFWFPSLLSRPTLCALLHRGEESETESETRRGALAFSS